MKFQYLVIEHIRGRLLVTMLYIQFDIYITFTFTKHNLDRRQEEFTSEPNVE